MKFLSGRDNLREGRNQLQSISLPSIDNGFCDKM